jgi:hypothetical protein
MRASAVASPMIPPPTTTTSTRVVVPVAMR